jgi:hypothetical protein
MLSGDTGVNPGNLADLRVTSNLDACQKEDRWLVKK